MTDQGRADQFKKIPGLSAPEARVLSGEDGSDGKAQSEAQQLSAGLSSSEIQRLAEKGEHERSERFKDHFERIAILSIYVFAGLIVALGFVWLWHVLAPPEWHWLPPENITKVQTLLTGGVLATILGGHVKKRLG